MPYYNRLCRINLSHRTWQSESIAPEIMNRYLGGKGLGTYLLLQEVPADVDPLGPANKVIFTVGPATSSGVPGAARYGVYSKSPLTGAYLESYSGGRVAGAIKATGYDAVIIEGAAAEPVWLEVSDQGVEFHSAADLWGKDTYSTEDEVLRRSGVNGARAVVIGPAGENLVRLACLENDYWRSAGRGGMGAVLGSKKVKAIVFHGNSRMEPADPVKLKEWSKSLLQRAAENPGAANYRKYGTPVMVAVMNNARAFPNRYWTRGVMPGWENISGDYLLANFKVQPRACPGCPLACGKLTEVTEGKYAGLKVEGPEYETIFAFGGLCCIDRLDEILYLNDLCDRLGLDTISAGNLIGLVMAAQEAGRLQGFPSFGDAEGAAELLKQMAYRTGSGAVLADGIKAASQYLGIEDLAVHVKGMEPAGYDPRVLKGMGLAYATSSRGACHLRATFYKAELASMIPPDQIEGKAALFTDFEDRLTIFNTQILCVFFRDLVLWPELGELLTALTGRTYSQEELRTRANEIITMTRVFNYRAGLTAADDRLPARLLAEPLADSGAQLTAAELNYMLGDYYRLRGWDEEGRPPGA